MSGRNIVEIAANADVDGTKAFESTFAAFEVHEFMLEFDPKHPGPPICTLSNAGSHPKEIHPAPLRGREGRYSAQVGGGSYSTIRVTTARNVKMKLIKVKLMGGHADHPQGGTVPPHAPKA